MVCDAMTRKPITVHPDTEVLECARLMKEHKIGSIVISDSEEVKGIVTEHDLVRKCLAEQRDPAKLKALEAGTENVVTISPEVDVFEAVMLMQDYDIRHLPVTDDGKMVGFITIKDILRVQPQLFELLADKIEIREHSRKLQQQIRESMEDNAL